MATKADKATDQMAAPAPLLLTRVLPFSRALVFRAWSSADHIKHWFCPEGFTVPEAELDCRAGGVFNLCMRAPDGGESWMRGHFAEVVAPERLSFLSTVSVGGEPRFKADTTVSFEETLAGTTLTVRQVYEILDPAFAAAIQGASMGWSQTLDKLGHTVRHLRDHEGPLAVHDTFRLERRYDAPPSRVFQAFTDTVAKAKWFAGGHAVLERTMDVRPGGREVVRGRKDDGVEARFDAFYIDVVPDVRLVYAYEMHMDARKISVSLATVEMRPDGTGTKLTVTEQGCFLDGYDDAGSRAHGTGWLLDRLGASLDSDA
jgi:uncharacterized protein YndB with AHSA1/START domain